jgi:hypothetical protein
MPGGAASTGQMGQRCSGRGDAADPVAMPLTGGGAALLSRAIPVQWEPDPVLSCLAADQAEESWWTIEHGGGS